MHDLPQRTWMYWKKQISDQMVIIFVDEHPKLFHYNMRDVTIVITGIDVAKVVIF
jgi:hypothetical protein